MKKRKTHRINGILRIAMTLFVAMAMILPAFPVTLHAEGVTMLRPGSEVHDQLAKLINQAATPTDDSEGATVTSIKWGTDTVLSLDDNYRELLSKDSYYNPLYAYLSEDKTSILVFTEADTIQADENCSSMFSGFNSIVSIDPAFLHKIDTGKVVDITGIFMSCASLSSIDLSGWKLDRAWDNNTTGAFDGCASLDRIITPALYSNAVIALPGTFLDKDDDGKEYTSIGGENNVTEHTLVRKTGDTDGKDPDDDPENDPDDDPDKKPDDTDPDKPSDPDDDNNPSDKTDDTDDTLWKTSVLINGGELNQIIKGLISKRGGYGPTAIQWSSLAKNGGTKISLDGSFPAYLRMSAGGGVLLFYSDAEKVTANPNMSELFEGLETITDFSGFLSHVDFSGTTDFSNMFRGCRYVRNIDLSAVDMSSAAKADGIFNGCTLLHTIKTSPGYPGSLLTALPKTFYNPDGSVVTDLSMVSPKGGTISRTNPGGSCEYIITAEDTGTGGTLSRTGEIGVRAGDPLLLVIVPANGKEFDHLVVDGNTINDYTEDYYLFNNVDKDHIICAYFKDKAPAVLPPDNTDSTDTGTNPGTGTDTNTGTDTGTDQTQIEKRSVKVTGGSSDSDHKSYSSSSSSGSSQTISTTSAANNTTANTSTAQTAAADGVNTNTVNAATSTGTSAYKKQIDVPVNYETDDEYTDDYFEDEDDEDYIDVYVDSEDNEKAKTEKTDNNKNKDKIKPAGSVTNNGSSSGGGSSSSGTRNTKTTWNSASHANDMPRTGDSDIYLYGLIIVALLAGCIVTTASIKTGKK